MAFRLFLLHSSALGGRRSHLTKPASHSASASLRFCCFFFSGWFDVFANLGMAKTLMIGMASGFQRLHMQKRNTCIGGWGEGKKHGYGELDKGEKEGKVVRRCRCYCGIGVGCWFGCLLFLH